MTGFRHEQRAQRRSGNLGKCNRSQSGRGGLFFVIEDKVLADGISDLIEGDTASTKIPKPAKK